MNVIIIEDETRAANRIKRLITEINPKIKIVEVIESVTLAISYLEQNSPDLIISDIQLADGLSFEIYKQITPKCPIIFTTAYDQYAIKAFKYAALDYLLKPIDLQELRDSVERAKKLILDNNTSDYQFAKSVYKDPLPAKLALPNSEGFDLIEINNVLSIKGNDNLEHISGFNLLETVNSNLLFESNRINNFSGFDNLNPASNNWIRDFSFYRTTKRSH